MKNAARFFSLLLLLCLLFAGSASAITLDNSLTTADPLANSSCQTPAARTAFSPADTAVYLWASLSNALIGDTAEWRWFSPDNALYASSTYTVSTFTGNGCTWGGIYISGQKAASLPGNWRVELYLNGVLSATASFTIGTSQRTDKGAVFIRPNSDTYVPGSFLDIRYQTVKGTLQGNVDIYLAVGLPSGQVIVAANNGAAVGPFLSNVTITDGTTPIVSSAFPVDLPFGTYTLYMLLVYAGADLTNALNWASPISQATFSYSALSPAQKSIIQSRGGNPDLLAASWVNERNEKRESWLYLSGAPMTYSFLNGDLLSQSTPSGSFAGTTPQLDPGLFSPQTTLTQLTAVLGPPAGSTSLQGAPNLQAVHYPVGLDVILRDGRFSSAVTSTP